MPDQVALARVARRAVVVDLLHLADVVQDGAGNEQVGVGAVGGGDGQRHADDAQDVFEQAATVGMVHGLRRGPDAEPLTVVGDDAGEQRADARIRHHGDVRLEFAPHLVEGTRRDRNQVFFVEARGAILVGVDAADAVDRQLQHALVGLARALDLDEVFFAELVAHARHLVEDLGLDGTAAILQREDQERIPIARRPLLLARAQVEPLPRRAICSCPTFVNMP